MMKPGGIAKNHKYILDNIFAIEPPNFLPVLSAGTSFLPSCFPPLFNSLARQISPCEIRCYHKVNLQQSEK